ncbi:MAG: glycosyltransferase family 4 protein [Chloroflexi bacterium]|nr:glycosyltransferase family 4 protein [Chloroflexota bacterium]
MKLLIATDTDVFPYGVGGVERFVSNLAAHLTRLGTDVEVVCGTDPRERLEGSPSPVFKLTRLPFPAGRLSLLSRRRLSASIARYITANESRYDVVYGQQEALWAYMARGSLPKVVNFHGLENFNEASVRRRLAGIPSRLIDRRIIAGRADRVISLGGRTSECLRKRLRVPPSRLVEVPNAVDIESIDRFGPRKAGSGGRRKWLFVGRLAYNKGADVLIKAFRQSGFAEEVELLVAGSGPLDRALRRAGAGFNIGFLGRIEDRSLFPLYFECDAFVFPTLNEGMPTVVLEAMAAGLPVIASDVGATRTMVSDDNGRLVRRGDVNGLVSAMRWLHGLSQAERDALGRRSRYLVETHYNWPAVAKRTLEVCQEVASVPEGVIRPEPVGQPGSPSSADVSHTIRGVQE